MKELNVDVIESEMIITPYRILSPSRQALVLRYVHNLAEIQAMESPPELKTNQDVVIVAPNDASVSTLCPYIPVSDSDILLVVISPDLEAAKFYGVVEMDNKLIYETTDYNEVVEILETILGLFEEKGQTEFSEYQKKYHWAVQMLVESDLG